MSTQPFTFKQFSVNQDKCAMKIGTDGVLLGAWATVKDNPFAILDIGAGTGIIALMLAQRSQAEVIDAIEIDDSAYEQCVDNFELSPWGDRLFCYHAGLDEFVDEIEDKYDLIISNPPFFTENYKTNDTARNTARFQDALPYNHLIESSSKLLEVNGKFVVIIPYKEKKDFINIAAQHKLYPNKILDIKGTASSPFKRSLIEFSFRESDIETNTLTIELERHLYTKDYIDLTKDFYLKM